MAQKSIVHLELPARDRRAIAAFYEAIFDAGRHRGSWRALLDP